MKKILSMASAVTLAAAMIATPVSASAENSKKDCNLGGIVSQIISGKLDSVCDGENHSSSCKAFEIISKLYDIKCVFSGDCENAGEVILPDADEEGFLPDISVPDISLPENEKPENTLPDLENTPQNPGVDQNADSSLASQVISLVNKYRAENGLSAVEYDATLKNAADKRAKEIETVFSHTRPDGNDCFSVLGEYGISYRGAGENIAMGQSSAEEVMNDWMNSDGHRKNILNPNFTKLSVGLHKGSDGRLYWTQLFIY